MAASSRSDSEWAELLRRELHRENLFYLLSNIEPPTLDLRIRLYTLLNEVESGRNPTETGRGS